MVQGTNERGGWARGQMRGVGGVVGVRGHYQYKLLWLWLPCLTPPQWHIALVQSVISAMPPVQKYDAVYHLDGEKASTHLLLELVADRMWLCASNDAEITIINLRATRTSTLKPKPGIAYTPCANDAEHRDKCDKALQAYHVPMTQSKATIVKGEDGVPHPT